MTTTRSFDGSTRSFDGSTRNRPSTYRTAAPAPAAATATTTRAAAAASGPAAMPPMRSRRRSALALLALLAIAGAVAVLGWLTSAAALEGWYAEAPKPMWNPSDAVFGPVWTVLYTVMSVSAWLVWRRPDSELRTRALRVYAMQLALNALWAPAFFGLGTLIGAPGLWIALGIIVVLDVAILATIIRFGEVSRAAAGLLVPYWFWVLFATTLNAAIAVLAR